MSIHHQAMRHFTKAKDLLEHGGEDDLRDAALGMRYCIEHIFYDYVPQYKPSCPTM